MKKNRLKGEMMYQITMGKVKKMLEIGLISKEEYAEIDTIFLGKYKPFFGTLFSENG